MHQSPMKTIIFAARFTDTIRRKLDYLASANGITPSEAVRRLIEFAQPEDLDLELRSNGLHRGASRRNGDG